MRLVKLALTCSLTPWSPNAEKGEREDLSEDGESSLTAEVTAVF